MRSFRQGCLVPAIVHDFAYSDPGSHRSCFSTVELPLRLTFALFLWMSGMFHVCHVLLLLSENLELRTSVLLPYAPYIPRLSPVVRAARSSLLPRPGQPAHAEVSLLAVTYTRMVS